MKMALSMAILYFKRYRENEELEAGVCGVRRGGGGGGGVEKAGGEGVEREEQRHLDEGTDESFQSPCLVGRH